MTTTDAPSKFRYEGNGATDTFAFNGRIFAAEDLIVEIILRADDSLVDTLTLTTDYSVTINGPSSASVVVTGGNIPSSLEDIQVRRDLDKTQSLVLPTGTVFPAKAVEIALDKTTAIIQELQEELDRTIKIPPQSSIDSLSITESPVDGKALVYSAADVGYINGPDAADIAAAQENAEDAIAAKDAAEAAQAAAEAAQAAAEAAAAQLPLSNYSAVAAPTVNDDSGDGYSVGSKWYDLTNDEAYICLDATLGAAVWVLATLDTEDLGTLAFVNTAAVNQGGTGLSVALSGFLNGYQMSTAGSSATMTIGAGFAADSTNAVYIYLSASISKTTSSWAVGTAQGGLDTGTIANNTWYRFYAIYRSDTGVSDVIFSANGTTPTLPANYTHYAPLWWGKTNGSGQWLEIQQKGNKFTFKNARKSSGVSIGTTRTLITIDAPPNVEAVLYINTGTATPTYFLVQETYEVDYAPTISDMSYNSYSSLINGGQFILSLDASSQIAARSSVSSSGGVVNLTAFTDRRV